MGELVPRTLAEVAREHLVPPANFAPAAVAGILALIWASLAEETWRGYQSSWRIYQRWCAAMELPPQPFNEWVLALYLAAHAVTHRPQTLERHLAALQQVHELGGGSGSIVTMVVRRTLRGIKRTYGTRPERKKAIQLDLLRDLITQVRTQDNPIAVVRDSALFTSMWAGALRASDARQLDVEGIRAVPNGLEVFLWRSKTDPFATGRWVPIGAGEDPLTDPVRHLRALLALLPPAQAAAPSREEERIPLFRGLRSNGTLRATRISARGIDAIFRRHIARLVDDPRAYATHGFRKGFVTAAKLANVADALIQLVTGHASSESLDDYVQPPSTLVLAINRRLGL
jgi:integrase